MIIRLHDPRREMGDWITKAQHLVGAALIVLASGQQHRLDLVRFTNCAAVQAAIISHAAAAGVIETASAKG